MANVESVVQLPYDTTWTVNVSLHRRIRPTEGDSFVPGGLERFKISDLRLDIEDWKKELQNVRSLQPLEIDSYVRQLVTLAATSIRIAKRVQELSSSQEDSD